MKGKQNLAFSTIYICHNVLLNLILRSGIKSSLNISAKGLFYDFDLSLSLSLSLNPYPPPPH